MTKKITGDKLSLGAILLSISSRMDRETVVWSCGGILHSNENNFLYMKPCGYISHSQVDPSLIQKNTHGITPFTQNVYRKFSFIWEKVIFGVRQAVVGRKTQDGIRKVTEELPGVCSSISWSLYLLHECFQMEKIHWAVCLRAAPSSALAIIKSILKVVALTTFIRLSHVRTAKKFERVSLA